MSGDAHVRICESLGVKFPRATRLVVVIRQKRYWLWRTCSMSAASTSATRRFACGGTGSGRCFQRKSE